MAARGGVRYLADYLWETPDDGNRYEVIDGELYVSPPPKWMHQRGLNKLNVRVANWVWGHDLGEVVAAPTGVVLSADTGVEPDLLYISRDRLDIISERGVEGAPDLVVEVLSPSTAARDRGVKMRRYAAAGIPHYWLLDPRSRVLEPYRLTPQGYELLGRFGPGTVFRPELFPGLEIVIDELWA
jgi:Uma2 family endonuclease